MYLYRRYSESSFRQAEDARPSHIFSTMENFSWWLPGSFAEKFRV